MGLEKYDRFEMLRLNKERLEADALNFNPKICQRSKDMVKARMAQAITEMKSD